MRAHNLSQRRKRLECQPLGAPLAVGGRIEARFELRERRNATLGPSEVSAHARARAHFARANWRAGWPHLLHSRALQPSPSPLSSDSARPLAPLDCGWRYSWSRLRCTRLQREAHAKYAGVRARLAPRPRVGWTGGGVAVAVAGMIFILYSLRGARLPPRKLQCHEGASLCDGEGAGGR